MCGSIGHGCLSYRSKFTGCVPPCTTNHASAIKLPIEPPFLLGTFVENSLLVVHRGTQCGVTPCGPPCQVSRYPPRFLWVRPLYARAFVCSPPLQAWPSSWRPIYARGRCSGTTARTPAVGLRKGRGSIGYRCHPLTRAQTARIMGKSARNGRDDKG